MFWRSVVLPVVVLHALPLQPELFLIVDLGVPLDGLLVLAPHILVWVVARLISEQLKVVSFQ